MRDMEKTNLLLGDIAERSHNISEQIYYLNKSLYENTKASNRRFASVMFIAAICIIVHLVKI